MIEHGSSLAALDALSALETAIHRVAPIETKQVEDEVRFREEWRPERLKALIVYEKAILKHSRVAVRYQIRQALKQDIAFEEDLVFAEECRRVLAKIPEDLALNVAVVILSHSAFEFEDQRLVPHDPDRFEKVQMLWNERFRETARRLATSYPAPDDLFDFLQQVAEELVEAGNHLSFSPLFLELAQAAPELAAGLAAQILQGGRDPFGTRLACLD